ncbi:SBBP repeat-containing protein [Longitalea arenae]|uniref:SBBP repeat-containing protein n=1 Tax=Longitalea arenae TaxID=2812558 RepID=UPI001968418C|nr:SBBP repeat-containing protein [Longitalea arenae]
MRNKLLFRQSLLLASLLITSAIGFAQVTEKWVKRQNGDANANDLARDLVVDCKGNVIVTGLADGDINLSGTNWATIKYNDDGEVKWLKRYNGPGNGSDEATAIATDSKANIFVTGSSTGIGTGMDITTIKYDDDGNTKWVKRYNGPGNDVDQASAINVDDVGNVYVTGFSRTGIGTASTIITIKYDDDGHTKWVRSFGTGAGNAIAVDKEGNVYVTGGSASGQGLNSDITTIKYNKNGDLQWARTYNGPVSLFDTGNDLALDPNGNVYVTGFISTADMETDETDIITIKYSTAGVQLWAAIYNNGTRDEANAIRVDAAGNAYITGFVGSAEEDPDNDLVTIKYNTAGVQQWASIFVTPGSEQNSTATDLVIDKAGNVYITGAAAIQADVDYITIKYNTNGVQQWIATYNGPGNDDDQANAIGIDEDGNVYVTGRSRIDNFDYATIKYNNNGQQKWVERFNGRNNTIKGGPDLANALALDKHGNVHVTGGVTRLNTGMDYTTYKYTPDADRIWKKTYNGTGIGPDQASAISVDANANVYVTGTSWGGSSWDDYATVKYGEDGDTKWVKRYNGPGNSVDQATAITTDEQGNVYVTGASIGANQFSDYATIKYDKDGNTKWVKRYNGPGNSTDRAVAIAVDKAGNVYVTGSSWGSTSFEDYTTIKYDANGNELWVARYNGPANSVDQANALSVDASGNVYITGRSIGGVSSYDFATIKYNTAGVQQWVARYEGPVFDDARDIAVDAAGTVYITGESAGDYLTIKYSTGGLQIWLAFYDGGASDVATALALDAVGNVYVTGSSSTSRLLFGDYATVKYNFNGQQQWVARYDGPAARSDAASDIAVDDDGNVYVTGSSEGIGTSVDYATIKYEQTPLLTRLATSPDEENPVIAGQGPGKLSAKAFPNAFTEYINLQWSGSNKPVTITITDMLGRLVERRTGLASSGNIRTGYQFTAGVYFAEIVQGREKVMLKLIKN